MFFEDTMAVWDSVLPSELALFVLLNFFLSGLAMAALVTTVVFLGQLSAAESQRLSHRLVKYAVFKMVFVGSVITPDPRDVAVWLAWFAVVGYLRVFLGAAKDRLESLIAAPAVRLGRHIRGVALLLLVLAHNVAAFLLVQRLLPARPAPASRLLLCAFDSAVIAIEGGKTALRYGEGGKGGGRRPGTAPPRRPTTDTAPPPPAAAAAGTAAGTGGGPAGWLRRRLLRPLLSRLGLGEGLPSLSASKGSLLYHAELAADVAVHAVTLAHYLHVWLLHGLRLHVSGGGAVAAGAGLVGGGLGRGGGAGGGGGAALLGAVRRAFELVAALGRYTSHGFIDAVLFLDMRAVLMSLLRRLRSHLSYRAVTRRLDTCFRDVRPLPQPHHHHAHHHASAAEGAGGAGATASGAAAVFLSGELDCTICMDPISEVGKELPCGHVFHLACLRAWLQQSGAECFTCPNCRQPVLIGEGGAAGEGGGQEGGEGAGAAGRRGSGGGGGGGWWLTRALDRAYVRLVVAVEPVLIRVLLAMLSLVNRVAYWQAGGAGGGSGGRHRRSLRRSGRRQRRGSSRPSSRGTAPREGYGESPGPPSPPPPPRRRGHVHLHTAASVDAADVDGSDSPYEYEHAAAAGYEEDGGWSEQGEEEEWEEHLSNDAEDSAPEATEEEPQEADPQAGGSGRPGRQGSLVTHLSEMLGMSGRAAAAVAAPHSDSDGETAAAAARRGSRGGASSGGEDEAGALHGPPATAAAANRSRYWRGVSGGGGREQPRHDPGIRRRRQGRVAQLTDGGVCAGAVAGGGADSDGGPDAEVSSRRRPRPRAGSRGTAGAAAAPEQPLTALHEE
ncbi:hypothetical protein GPECTOR_15g426 [Gonium pectorale]|uniref:RING-type domain-containing protein n=1 Tax=Gonium pectorale TaxID=33097 RepID=A0A150GLS2_GONPE|nr:hypothetical protein GPECTOR_15g426 [Gonium pectorale]|eukprot:KXZ50741.1 hypothetical protein GPECTOR_15g426 [Gonium pectorale]